MRARLYQLTHQETATEGRWQESRVLHATGLPLGVLQRSHAGATLPGPSRAVLLLSCAGQLVADCSASLRQPGVLQHLRCRGALAGVEVEHGQQEVAQGQRLHGRGHAGGLNSHFTTDSRMPCCRCLPCRHASRRRLLHCNQTDCWPDTRFPQQSPSTRPLLWHQRTSSEGSWWRWCSTQSSGMGCSERIVLRMGWGEETN